MHAHEPRTHKTCIAGRLHVFLIATDVGLNPRDGKRRRELLLTLKQS